MSMERFELELGLGLILELGALRGSSFCKLLGLTRVDPIPDRVGLGCLAVFFSSCNFSEEQPGW